MRSGLAVVVAAVLIMGGIASAQDSSVAEKLFREGKRLIGEGKIAEACKAFDGSYRKDPQVTTLLNLADCREKNKQYATAWGYFLDVVRIARERPEAAAFGTTASARAAKLEKRLSYLIINVPADAAVEGLVITRNGVVVDEAEWNTDIPIDGGEYILDGKAPGYETWSTKVTIVASGDRKSVNVPRFRSRPATDLNPVETTPTGDAGTTTTTAAAAESRVDTGAGGSGRTPAVVLMSGGGVLVAGGLAAGFLANQKWREVRQVCGADHVCDNAADRAEADAIIEDAKLRGNVSTALVGVGVVAGGVGTYLFLRARGKSADHASLRVTPVVSGDSGALVVGGRF